MINLAARSLAAIEGRSWNTGVVVNATQIRQGQRLPDKWLHQCLSWCSVGAPTCYIESQHASSMPARVACSDEFWASPL